MWNTTGVWVMLVVACLIGVSGAARARFRVAGRPRRRQSPLLLVEACIDVLLTGLGIGIAAVFLVLLVARAFTAIGI